jgi:hypothetical protein
MNFDGLVGEPLGIGQVGIGPGDCHEVHRLHLTVSEGVSPTGAKLKRAEPLKGIYGELRGTRDS